MLVWGSPMPEQASAKDRLSSSRRSTKPPRPNTLPATGPRYTTLHGAIRRLPLPNWKRLFKIATGSCRGSRLIPLWTRSAMIRALTRWSSGSICRNERMKKCPQCGREYDNTMSFCLDDGAELLYGPRSEPPALAGGQFNEPPTAILHETASPSEGRTRAQIHTTEQTAVSP